MTQTVLFSRDGGTGRIVLNRPEAGNALNGDMMQELRALAETLRQDTNLRVIVLEGSGANFCVGGDIRALAELAPKGRAGLVPFIEDFHLFIRALRHHSAPVLAVVRGAAAGGGLSMMLAADFVLAAEDAKFSLAYRRIGTSCDGGASFFLPQRVGALKAAELMLLRDIVEAREALELGLVNWLGKGEELESEALRIAALLSRNAPLASANFKRLIAAPMAVAFEAHLDLEREAFAACAQTDDFREGLAAFLEKRPAQFGAK